MCLGCLVALKFRTTTTTMRLIQRSTLEESTSSYRPLLVIFRAFERCHPRIQEARREKARLSHPRSLNQSSQSRHQRRQMTTTPPRKQRENKTKNSHCLLWTAKGGNHWVSEVKWSPWSVRLYIYPSGASRSSIRDHPRSWSWKTSRLQSYTIVTERIGSWWTYRNVFAHIRSCQFGEPDRDDRIRSRPNRRLDCNNPIGTYVIVSEREIRPWLIVTPEIDKSYGSHPRQQIVSERIDSHHLVSKPEISEKIPRPATNDQSWRS